ncbi:serine/threonine protein phosphatase 2A 57 kDa regulatory subunit B' alpha isoform-like [Salvia splendens]|uniref:serine/threonine protein phosphatase 2A 57 kDa regulatory subunit B' alpha isoform-like n=1 Tax=Salvia splendens TaxID=180675 RepID=UPI001C260D4F|nr:serine/threonine protein phosphatase 2A 57 kDa regulatory subunit B' alpha isoform-like [Salvia splendens]
MLFFRRSIKRYLLRLRQIEKRRMGAHRNSPKSKKMKANTLKSLLELDSMYRRRSSEHYGILSLISHCSYTSTFVDPSESPSLQCLKRDKLIKLLSLLKPMRDGPCLPDEVLSPLFSMIQDHLFRRLPPPSTSILLDEDDLIATPAATWPHLQPVYDILLCLVTNMEPKTLGEYIKDSFILNLLALFKSDDVRERESLKKLYHQIYSKFHGSRSFMRKAMNDVFLHYTFEGDEKHAGIGDLLEILGTIINGFSVPLKEEHRLLLMRVLMPLHRPKGMQAYHKQLAYCVHQFVEKEPVLGVAVVSGILRYWPTTNCHKEIVLIGELGDLVENMETEEYKAIALPLCKRITKCFNSQNSQVAERALYMWNNERFVKMALQAEAVEEVLSVVVEGMEENVRGHWSKSVRQLTHSVKEMLVEMEPVLYARCLVQLDHRHLEAEAEAETKRKQRWERVEMAAKLNQFILESLRSGLPD